MRQNDIWLFLATLFGFGGIFFSILIGITDPQWCQAPFVGCLGAMILLAAGGWIVGLLCSIIALVGRKKWRIAAWLLLAWNACGCVLTLSFFVALW
jgi:predicted histidine transporter YuiF (NhaC family)